ncbi:UNVERIFIED_CONTAM: hypothetical protein HDU68_001111 [Siphonaria sp. JEL0065]|nr:hypothetical protein HDU68_001111 [Siphonaria sp. JEL0065]
MLHLDITVAPRNISDPFPIPVPTNDPVFKIPGSPEDFIPVYRSNYLGVDNTKNLRIIPNAFTAFIDCSGLYGNSDDEMKHMRSFQGGKLKSVFLEKGEFPPIIENGPMKGYFDFNIPNLNMMPVVMHPDWDDELLFQRARRWVIAVVQKITVNNYIPAVTGTQLDPYAGYNPNIDPGIDLYFANVAFRYGAINQLITRIDESGNQVREGHIVFHKAFFEKLASQVIKHGVESILRGFATQKDQVIDTHFVSEVRNYLPLNPGHYFDLAAIGIQRGRELGIPSYANIRGYFNLTRPYYWSDITSDLGVQQTLSQLYDSVEELDAYVGAFAEDKIDPHSIVSPIQRLSIRNQFTRIRDGDRFWYENPGVLSQYEMMELSTFSLGAMVRLNTNCTFYPNNPLVATPLASGFFLKGPANVQRESVSNTVSLMGKLLLSWKILASEGYITFRLESNSSGWFGFGFGSSMLGADIYFCNVLANGSFSVQDSWSSATQPIPSDVSQGGKDSIFNVADITSSQSYSARVVEFSRLLDTGDPFDVAIVNQPMDVIFAYSDNNLLVWHGAQNRMSAKVNFFTSLQGLVVVDQGPTISPGLKAIHGASMYLAFGFIYPLGIFVARYYQNLGTWLSIHRSLMTVITSNVLMAALTAIVGSYGDSTYVHYKIGIVVIFTVLGSLTLGHLSVHYHEKISKFGSWAERVRFIHRSFGYSTYILGLVCGYSGVVDIMSGTPYVTILPWVYVATVTIPPIALVAYGELVALPASKNKSIGGADLNGLPVFTWDDVNQRVAAGSKWLVIEGFICKSSCYFIMKLIHDLDDAQKYVYSHPGGASLILKMVGLDATREFNGSGTHRKETLNSQHSNSKSFLGSLKSGGSLTRKKTLGEGKSQTNATKVTKKSDLEHEHKHTRFAKFLLAGLAVGKLREEVEQEVVQNSTRISQKTSTWSVAQSPIPTESPSDSFSDKYAKSARPAMLTERFLTFEFDKKMALTDPHDKQPIYMFRFLFADPESELSVKPGHCFMLQFVAEDGKVVTRSYWALHTINKGGIDFIIKIVGGEMTSYLMTCDSVRMRGPMPDCDVTNPYSENGTWKVLGIITDGIGLTGAFLLIDYHLRNCKRDPVTNRPNFQIHLLACFSNESEMFALKELAQLEASSNGALVVTTLLKVSMTRGYNGLIGSITSEVILATMPKPDIPTQWASQDAKMKKGK